MHVSAGTVGRSPMQTALFAALQMISSHVGAEFP
jgi:hypothetical protein